MFFRFTAVNQGVLLHSKSLEDLQKTQEFKLPMRRFSGPGDSHVVSFGTLQLSPQIAVSLSGEIKCPFPFINKSVAENITEASELLWNWSVKHGFFQDTAQNRLAFEKYNLIQFAAYTVVSIPELSIDVISEIKSGKSTPQIIANILESSVPLTSEQLFRQGKYLLWLFRHDNWAETHNDVAFIRSMHIIFLDALKTRKPRLLTDEKYATLRPSERSSEEKQFMNAFISSISDIGKDFYRAFHARAFVSRDQYLGYSDFCNSVERYLGDQATEATYRIENTSVSPDLARRIRREACGVYSVDYAALAESQVPILRDIPFLSPVISRISEAFSYLICHFNDLISAPREFMKPNWKNNEISLLYEERFKDLFDSEEEGYAHAVEGLFRKVNLDLKDALTDIEAISQIISGPDQEDMNTQLLSVLIDIAVKQQWSIGSMPAQMALDLHSQHRPEGPYIKKGECLNGDSDFWRFAALR